MRGRLILKECYALLSLLEGINMKIKIKGKEYDVDKNFFLDDGLGRFITAIGTTVVLGSTAGGVVVVALIYRSFKKAFKK